ncbi:phage tail protein [Streptomyces rubellomurinus]|uniref:phage tail protein n=1 Tax=Streptomyces rubellomurinus (strain ATCC 31215) TaxID=359131 RepID=UPI0005F2151D|nr:phage tail protein [Streptomyces rubellomurinus]
MTAQPHGRGLVPGLRSRHPLGAQLPGVYAADGDDRRENAFLQQFTGALDEVLAPVLCALDNLAAYFDPRLAPPDFLAYLAQWVGASTGPELPPDRLRAAVAYAAPLHAVRGTRAGLAAQVRLAFGAEPEIEESGGARWSARPQAPLPGSPEPRLLVRLRVADPAAVDLRALRELVAANRPAHLPFTVEVVRAAGPATAGEASGEGHDDDV